MRKLPSRFDPMKNIFVGRMGIKRYCTKCKEFKKLDAFNRDPKRPNHQFSQYSQCNSCLNSYGEKYRQEVLKYELDSGAKDIKECGCGRLYKFIKSNGHRLDACRFCLKDGKYLRNNK